MKIQPVSYIDHMQKQYARQQMYPYHIDQNAQYSQKHFTSDIKDQDTDTTLFHCDIYASNFLDACRQMRDALKQREEQYRQQYPNGLKHTTIMESEEEE